MGDTTKGARILWDFQTDKQLLANQPSTVVADKEQKTTTVIDVAIPVDSMNREVLGA